MERKKSWLEQFKNFWPILLLIVLIIPVLLPLFNQGMFVSDDGEWMVIRFSAFHQALRDGQFPVRWLGRLNHGYGYPVANFLYPGFMYLAEIPKILGFGFINSIKIILGVSVAGSAIFTYLWLKTNFGNLPALLGAFIYLYTPYHLWDLYKRGSVGEVLALAIIPFILWMIEKKNLFAISLGIGFLILSHNTLAVLFLPVILCYVLLRTDKLVTMYDYMSTIILGLGVAAFFWIPAIFDLRYTKFFQTQVSNWQDHFGNISLIGWGTIIVLLVNISLIFHYKNRYFCSKVYWFFLIVGLGSIFFALPLSGFIWQYLPVSFIQFPFRLLSVAVISLSFLSAFIADKLKGERKVIYVVVLLMAVFVSVSPYDSPADFSNKGEGFYATNEATTTVANEYMPIWVKEPPGFRPKERVKILSGRGEISNIFANLKQMSFEINSKTESEIQINTVYFPGWGVRVDKKPAEFSFDNPKGLIILSVPEGKHKVELLWKETTLRKFSDMISITCLAILIMWSIVKKRKIYV